MPSNSPPLQDLPLLGLRASRTSKAFSRASRTCRTSSRASSLKPSGGEGGGLGPESTPTSSSLLHWSPPHKVQRLSTKEKENQEDQENQQHFVLGRRSRRKRPAPTGTSWDQLPEELLLRVLILLPMKDLLRTSTVSRRWRRLALDSSLWTSVDLEGLSQVSKALQQVLRTRVLRLRCPRCYMEDLNLPHPGPLQLLHLDLSSSILSCSVLEALLSCCRQLECLSLEGLRLSDAVLRSLALNPSLLQLNLSGCSSFSASALAHMLSSCYRMEQLSLSWCSFSSHHVRSVVSHVSTNLTHLNLSGYRESLTLDDMKMLVDRCPQIQTLDLSDSTLLTAECLSSLQPLRKLLHLSLSRCYHIHLAALTDVGRLLPSLVLLDVFGLLQDGLLASLRKELPHISINSRPFSSVARPTPASRPPNAPGDHADHAMWNRTCRLRFRQ